MSGIRLPTLTVSCSRQSSISGNSATSVKIAADKARNLKKQSACRHSRALAEMGVDESKKTSDNITIAKQPTFVEYPMVVSGPLDLGRIGHIDEWHLDFDNSFCHIAFDFGAWPRQPSVVIASPFLQSGFEAIRPVCDSMLCNGIDQVSIELLSV